VKASRDFTPPLGIPNQKGIAALISTAAMRADSDDERRRVKEAREAFGRQLTGRGDYDATAKAVSALGDLLLEEPASNDDSWRAEMAAKNAGWANDPARSGNAAPAKAEPEIHLEASSTPGVYFARSRRNPANNWRTTETTCTCEARVLCAHSKAVRAMHSKAVAALVVEWDAFGKVSR
jgi:hypothetical protein